MHARVYMEYVDTTSHTTLPTQHYPHQAEEESKDSIDTGGGTSEMIAEMGMRKIRKDHASSLDERVRLFIERQVVPFACKSNTDTFRGELAMDEVQGQFKRFKPELVR